MIELFVGALIGASTTILALHFTGRKPRRQETYKARGSVHSGCDHGLSGSGIGCLSTSKISDGGASASPSFQSFPHARQHLFQRSPIMRIKPRTIAHYAGAETRIFQDDAPPLGEYSAQTGRLHLQQKWRKRRPKKL